MGTGTKLLLLLLVWVSVGRVSAVAVVLTPDLVGLRWMRRIGSLMPAAWCLRGEPKTNTVPPTPT